MYQVNGGSISSSAHTHLTWGRESREGGPWNTAGGETARARTSSLLCPTRRRLIISEIATRDHHDRRRHCSPLALG